MLGFFISAVVFYALNVAFPPKDAMSQYDEFDIYGTFTSNEARRVGVVPNDDDGLGEEHVVVHGQVRKT
jgi:NCS1 family nucleobase:cation symporter-1